MLFLGYIFIALAGAFILTLKGMHKNPISFIDALFTSTSAISMTGLIVKNTANDFTFWGQFVILCLIKIGGFGYMGLGLFVYLLIRKKIGFSGKNLLKESMIYPTMDGLLGFLKKVFLFVFIIELCGAILLSLRFMLEMDIKHAVWSGIFHSISAFNNAGFSIFETGLMSYRQDIWINLVITSLIIIGGIGYFVLLEVYFFQKKRLATLSLHTKIVLTMTFTLIIFATLVIFLLEYNNIKSIGSFSLFDKILSSYFTAVNYRTAGFNTLDFSTFKDASLFFGSLFMVIGGSPGGTSGGIKVTTVAILLIYAYWTIRGGRIRIFKYELSQDVISKAFVISIGSSIYMILCVMLLSLLESDHPFLTLLFETSSAFATVGVSVGDGGTLSLSALFGSESKLIIIIMMISGRIGIFAFLLSIFIQEKEKYIRYPEGKVYL
ncbi:TrkH family potassium uptake protein [Campylobacter sp. US33a]